jgi:chemotaxis protein MotA
MFVIIGIIVVIGAVFGGYVMAHGHLAVLFQPAELVIIGGAAVGTLLIGNPPHILTSMLKGILGILKGSHFSKAGYLQTLKMYYELFSVARKGGLAALETDVDEPSKSAVFSKYPKFLADHHSCSFVCDTLRVMVTGGMAVHDLDQIMELDMEVHHHESTQPVASLNTVADSLPGLGIVAAVLGVVITMGALGGPPEEIGHKVAAALVGTFLGILLCYGFLGPIAAVMSKGADEHLQYLHVLRVGLLGFSKGLPPIMAVEVARRAVPARLRPTFKEMEQICRKGA